jgi:hypothetical protein
MKTRPRELLTLSLCAGLCLVFVVPLKVCGQVPQARTPVRHEVDERIQGAIDRAAASLLKNLKTETDGYAALEATALLKCGHQPDNPAIREVCNKICSRIDSSKYNAGMHFVYEAGVSLMCLANADAKKYKPQITILAKFIIENQGSLGQWHYRNAPDGDTSISQYAILGLWEASRAGVEIPIEVWDKAAQWHLKFQQKDGGFAYHPENLGPTDSSLHSMTAAAVGSLQIIRLHLYPGARDLIAAEPPSKKKVNKTGKRFGVLTPVFRGEGPDETTETAAIAKSNTNYVRKVRQSQIDEALSKGLNWLTSRFTVDRPTGYPIYYLYALERAAALSNREKLGDHDWYREGADHLIATQGADHGWKDSSGEAAATAFGILFLSRATQKMVNKAPRVDFGTGILIGGRGLPDDLRAAQVNNGKVKAEDKKKAPLEELLAQLENPQTVLMETAQTEIVEQVVIGDRNALIGQVDRLKKLAVHPEADIRRTALWALGRSGDLRLAPLIIKSLQDPNVDVYIEARNALRCLSRDVEDFKPEEAPLDANVRSAELAKWNNWYRQIRDYAERDDLRPKSQ